jgi:hypothetical protein
MGHPSKHGQLRAHLWFMLDKPMTCLQAERWAKLYLVRDGKPLADHTVHRTVQVNYTANPVRSPGAPADPHAGQRVGFVEGLLGDTLIIPDDMPVPEVAEGKVVARAERTTAMKDPREAPGIVGAFSRAFTPFELPNLWPEHFLRGSTPNRITWRNGGGSPEGIGVGDQGTHLFNMHATSPTGGRAQRMWDFVRVHVYGDLDGEEPENYDFDIAGAPSWKAMEAWARLQPRVIEELERHRGQVVVIDSGASPVFEVLPKIEDDEFVDGIDEKIHGAQSIAHLRAIATAVSVNQGLAGHHREILAIHIQARTREIEKKAFPIGQIRAWVASIPIASGKSFVHLNKMGDPKLTRENLEVLLRRHNTTVRYNVISKQTVITGPGMSFSPENYYNAALAALQSRAAEVSMPNSMQPLSALLCLIADSNQYNPVLNWIEGRPWDGRSRFEELFGTITLRDGFDRDLAALMLRKWLLQAVAAAASPEPLSTRGVLTLQGRQYMGKTRWLSRLVGEHTELGLLGVQLDPHNKDSVMAAIGHWIVELGEVGGTFRRSDQNALKAFLGNTHDTFRVPYAAKESRFQRRTVFAASVNEDSFLADDTGSTRYWVLPVLALDHSHEIDMQQLWAEILAAWRGGEAHWMSPEEMERVEASNVQFMIHDEVTERLENAFRKLIDAARSGDPTVEWVERSTVDIAFAANITKTDRATLTRIGQVVSSPTEGAA